MKKRKQWSITSVNRRTIAVVVLVAVVMYAAIVGWYTHRRMVLLEERLANAVGYEGKTYIQNPDMMTLLCLGIDKANVTIKGLSADEYGDADVIVVAGINKKTNEVKLVNIPRDTIVYLTIQHGNLPVRKADGQICLQYMFGQTREECTQLMMDVISEQVLPGLTFDHYVSIGFRAVRVAVNDIGGLTVTLDGDLPAKNKMDHKAHKAGETLTLNGKQALWYARWRDWDEGEYSNLNRISRQKNFLKAFLHDVKAAIKADPTLVATLYNDLSKYMDTDISLTEATALATDIFGSDLSLDRDFKVLEGEAGAEVSDLDDAYHAIYTLDKHAAVETMLETFFVEVDTDTGEIKTE